jgi:hypothetical protein
LSASSGFDSADERRQPALGCARDSRRIALARHRDQPGHGRQIHGAKTRNAFADLRSFLRNQATGIAAIDMFVVASASFRLLYVMIILAHDPTKIVRFDVTRYPTAGWLARLRRLAHSMVRPESDAI